MNKRTFLKTSGIITAATLVNPFYACTSEEQRNEDTSESAENKTEETARLGNFELPNLDYDFAALEPHIDKMTMEVHHGKHHAGYVKKLNAALEGSDYAGKSIEDIMKAINEDDVAIRNNGGGHYNHSLFWKSLSPKGGGKPEGKLAEVLNASFGDFDKFKDSFNQEAKSVFGSGWAWLCQGEDQKLFICATPNQDNPLMANIAEKTGKPLLGIDVWEHAYYLKYQNKRGDYISAFWNVINWEEVAKRLA